jgi:hypothetical protein
MMPTLLWQAHMQPWFWSAQPCIHAISAHTGGACGSTELGSRLELLLSSIPAAYQPPATPDVTAACLFACLICMLQCLVSVGQVPGVHEEPRNPGPRCKGGYGRLRQHCQQSHQQQQYLHASHHQGMCTPVQPTHTISYPSTPAAAVDYSQAAAAS